MNRRSMKLRFFATSIGFLLGIGLGTMEAASAKDGGQDGGGGDSFVQDFIQVAKSELLPWIVKNGSNMFPAVDSHLFEKSILDLVEDKTITSDEVVYESCDGSQIGRIVEICYNYKTNVIVISRTRYPLEMKKSAIKRKLVAHELFRKLRLEGDGYSLSNQMHFDDLVPEDNGQQLKARCVLGYEGPDETTESHLIATHGKTEGERVNTGYGIQTELSMKPYFIAQLITYSPASNIQPRIYLVAYETPFQSFGVIEAGGTTRISISRILEEQTDPTIPFPKIVSLEANCEIFQ